MCYPAHPTKSSKVNENVFLATVGLLEDLVKLCDTLLAMFIEKYERMTFWASPVTGRNV